MIGISRRQICKYVLTPRFTYDIELVFKYTVSPQSRVGVVLHKSASWRYLTNTIKWADTFIIDKVQETSPSNSVYS